jgi:carboxymethylenebutenolidase
MFSDSKRTTLACSFSANPNRRRFLARTAHAAEKMTILALLPTLVVSKFAAAAQIAADDPGIRTERMTIGAEWGKLDCYLARPTSDANLLPAVVVVHDRLGLTPHFEDVARHFAIEGFIALAPDYASRYGGTPSEPGPALEVVGMATWPEMTADTETALQWLKEKRGSEHIGGAGFGLGGTAISYAAARLSDLMAAAVYYGHPTPLADLVGLKAPLLLNLAGRDQFVDPEIPGFVEAVKKTGVKFEMYRCEGTARGFDDDSAPAHYSAEAARLAWSRTVTFLKAALA